MVHHQIWFALGNIQQGMNQFSNNYLTNNFSASIDFKREYTFHAASAVFVKTFDLDSDDTLNEFIFASYGRLQSICLSKTLSDKILLPNVLSEFLVLYNLILYGHTSEWIVNTLRISSPYVEGNRLKKIRPNFTETTIREMLIEEAKNIKGTDWYALNISLLDYLKQSD